MPYSFQFSPYRRRFKRPLATHHGVWSVREGVILRLASATGAIGWGEIAPVPWFGSETLEQALAFCRQLPTDLSESEILSVPDSLPACQFGLESAWEDIQNSKFKIQNSIPPRLSYSRLLPAGEAALSVWKPLYQQGFRTLKWKIAVEPIAHELTVFEHLIQALPAVNLRLDANGGLSVNEAEQWLERCDRLNTSECSVQVEYLEQPLPPSQFTTMQSLSDRYRTPIALDESIATLPQLCTYSDRGWSGVFVIKPAIAGSPIRLREFCRSRSIDAVFSTVFETAIGRQAGLRLAADLGRDRAVGYEGTFDEFDYFQEEKWNEELGSIGGSEPTTIG